MKRRYLIMLCMLIALLFCINGVSAVSDDVLNDTLSVMDSYDESIAVNNDEQVVGVENNGSALASYESDEKLGSDYPSMVEDDEIYDYMFYPQMYIFKNCAIINPILKDDMMDMWAGECTEEGMFSIPDELYEGDPNFHFNLSFFNTTTNTWQSLVSDDYHIPFPGYDNPDSVGGGIFDNVHSYYSAFDFNKGLYNLSMTYDGGTVELEAYNWDTEEYETDVFNFYEFTTEMILNIGDVFYLNLNNGVSSPITVYEGNDITVSPSITISKYKFSKDMTDNQGLTNELHIYSYFKDFDMNTEFGDYDFTYDDYYHEFNPDDFSSHVPNENITITIKNGSETFKTYNVVSGESCTINDLPAGAYTYTASYSDPYYGSRSVSNIKITVKEVPSPIYNGGGINALYEAIGAHDVIYLNEDVIYNVSTDARITGAGTTLTKNLTIYGNNHTIDVNNKLRLFEITNNAIVILKDLTIINSQGPYNGGAITLSSGTLTVENCTFKENYARSSPNGVSGGAIYIGNSCNLTVRDSVFDSNYILPNSNRGTYYGGAISCGDYAICNISNTSFSNNYLDKGSYNSVTMYGGAISSTGANSVNIITNCTFKNNTASNGRGAVYTRIANITGCIFDDNHGSDDNISVYYDTNGRGTISYNVFLDNSTQIMLKNNAANVVEQYNWWATNEPENWTCIENTYKLPNRYLMIYAYNENKVIKVGFLRDSNMDNIPNIELLPSREVFFEGDVDNSNIKTINGLASVNYNSEFGEGDEVNITIDGYTLTYTPKYNITSSDVIYVKDTTLMNNGTIIIQFTGNGGSVDGDAIVYLNDTRYDVKVENGLAVLEVGSEYYAGIYDIYYEYLGSLKYFATMERIKDDSKFEVKKADTIISYKNERNVITVNLSQTINPTGSINVTIGNVTKNLTLTDGVAKYNFGLDIDEIGTYDLKIIYEGDDNYNNATLEDSFEIAKANVTFEGVPDEIILYRSEYSHFEVHLLCNGTRIISTGSLYIYDDNNNRYKYGSWGYLNPEDWLTDRRYMWSFTLTGNNFMDGAHEMNMVYSGDGYYLPNNISFKLFINPTLSVKANVSEDSSVTLYINTSSTDAGGNYTVSCNDEIIGNGTLVNGEDTLALGKFNPGKYNIKVIWNGDEKYAGINTTTSFHVIETSQWPSLGGNPYNNGIANVTRNDNVVILWNATIGGDLHSSPIIDNAGNIYINDGTIRAFTNNGTLKWTAGSSSAGIALYDDEIILSPIAGNNMRIYDTNGNWLNGLSYGHASSIFAPVIGPDGRIYTPSQYPYAPDADDYSDSGNCWISIFSDDNNSNNELPYRFYFVVHIDDIGYGSEALKASPSFDSNGHIYANTVKGLIIADIKTGDNVFENPYINGVGRPVIDKSDIAYILDSSINGIYSLTFDDGILWNKTMTGGIGTTLAVDNENGFLYAVNANGVLYKYNTADGSETLVYDLGSKAQCILLDANSNVYVSTVNGNVTALNADGELIWTINLGSKISGQMAINREGTIYAVADNKLFALGSTTSITLNTSVDYNNAKVIITAILGDNTTGNVVFTVDNDTVSEPIPVEGNVAIWEIPLAIGNHSIKAELMDTTYYAPANTTTEITINPLSVEFTGVPEEIILDKSFYEFTFNLIYNNTNISTDVSKLKIYVNDEEMESGDRNKIEYDDNGFFVIRLFDFTPDTYNMTLSFTGSNYYLPANVTFKLTALPKVSANVSVVEDNIVVNVTTAPDATGKIFVKINDTGYFAEIENGKAIFIIPKLEAGNYTAVIDYEGDENYDETSIEVPFNVCEDPVIELQNPQLSASANNTTVTVTVNENATGYVLVDVEGISYYAEISDGQAVVDVKGLESGENYTATVTYFGDDNFTNASETVDISVPAEEVIELKDPNLKLDINGTVITVSIDSEATGEVIVTVGDISFVRDAGDLSPIDVSEYLSNGTYSVTVKYVGDDNFTDAAQIGGSVSVPEEDVPEPATPEMTVEVTNTTVTVTVNENATGYILVDVGGNGYYAEISDGQAVVDVKGLEAGNYTAVVTYLGDEQYMNKSENANITVIKEEAKTPEMTVSVTDTTLGVNLPGDATGFVIVDVANAGYYAQIKNGKATIKLFGLESGNNYTAAVTYLGDEIYNSANKTAIISLPKDVELLTPTMNVNITDELIAVEMEDNATGFILVNVDDTGYYAPLVNGETSIKVHDLTAGNHTVDIIYTGDKNYKQINKTEVISVIKALGTIISNDLVKIEKNASRFEAVFTDAKGNILTNKTVTFTINGQTYTRTTDNTGKAGMNVNLVAGTYSIIINNTETGEVKINNIIIHSKITENPDLVKYYKNASRFSVRLLDDNGNPVKAGETVQFNINGLLYDRTTDESGYASIAINLQAGTYTVTSQYKNCKVANEIKVLPILSASDLTKKYGVRQPFTANLVDGTGKALANTNVTFNINGVFYTRTTDANGTVSLNINLQAGEYIITTSYNGFNIANKVTITS